MKLLLYDKYFDALIKLPRTVQKRVIQFQKKFRENPETLGIHLEPIKNAKDPQLRSARINKEYRAILRAPESGNVYHLLWVDHHDAAYEWAMNKMAKWNENTHNIQVITLPKNQVQTSTENNKNEPPETTISKYPNDKLLRIGVPDELMSSIRDINDFEDLEKLEDYLPDSLFENLFFLLDGADIDSLITEIEEGKSDKGTFEEQQLSINNQRSFIEYTDDEIFNELLVGELKKWKYYLHPSQRKLVEKSFNGPMKITGGAGTGKTVVALHRLKMLSQNRPPKGILFVTYTNALTKNLKNQIQDLGVKNQYYHLDNIDALARNLALQYGLISNSDKIIYSGDNGRRDELWDELLMETLVDDDKKFLIDEYYKVILYHNITSRKEYFKVLRIGRGKAISRRKRSSLWSVFQQYNTLKEEKGLIDREQLCNIVHDYFSSNEEDKPYDHVIADELQDLSNVELRFLRSLTPERSNDLFLVGDPFQKIYDRKINFSKVGINVRGKRSRKLKINYRTSEEIRRKAIAVVDGEYFDDFDGNKAKSDGYLSLFHGEPPQYSIFKSRDIEIQFIYDKILELLESIQGLKLSEIVVASKRKNVLKDIKSKMHAENIPFYDVVNSSGTSSGLHFSTLHSLKGLEYKFVFLMDVSSNTFPDMFTGIENWTEEEIKDYLKTEKALFYVSMTRAIHGLIITGIGEKSEWVPVNLA